jgi:hypothetical protein
MIATELLEELRHIRRNFDWYYDGSTQRIRGRLKSQNDDNRFDPIGAVCYAKTGVTFNESDWWRSAELLELSHIDAGDLTAAANNVTTGPGHVRTEDLRREMIDSVLLPQEVEGEESPVGVDPLVGLLFPRLRRRKAHGGVKS